MKSLFKIFVLPVFLIFMSVPSLATENIAPVIQDSYVRETSPSTNYGSENILIADGVSQDPANGTFGEVVSLVQWDVSAIPPFSVITGAELYFFVRNSSGEPYHILQQLNPWTETTVNWTDLSTNTDVLGVIPAGSVGDLRLNLNSAGLAVLQGWVDGSIPNNGFAIRTSGTNDGISLVSREFGPSEPGLRVTFTARPLTNEELTAEIIRLKALLAGITRTGNNLNFDGMNVRIRNGLGATNGDPANPNSPFSAGAQVNGLGNLIVGYDEDSRISPSNKTGSHNVVIGNGHNYSSFGGLVAGDVNEISGPYSTVSGGAANVASGHSASVSGGGRNTASGEGASVSGGLFNSARDSQSSVSGGAENIADGDSSSVSGGFGRTAPNDNNWAAGSLSEPN